MTGSRTARRANVGTQHLAFRDRSGQRHLSIAPPAWCIRWCTVRTSEPAAGLPFQVLSSTCRPSSRAMRATVCCEFRPLRLQMRRVVVVILFASCLHLVARFVSCPYPVRAGLSWHPFARHCTNHCLIKTHSESGVRVTFCSGFAVPTSCLWIVRNRRAAQGVTRQTRDAAQWRQRYVSALDGAKIQRAIPRLPTEKEIRKANHMRRFRRACLLWARRGQGHGRLFPASLSRWAGMPTPLTKAKATAATQHTCALMFRHLRVVHPVSTSPGNIGGLLHPVSTSPGNIGVRPRQSPFASHNLDVSTMGFAHVEGRRHLRCVIRLPTDCRRE
jgi:hypothetical protein